MNTVEPALELGSPTLTRDRRQRTLELATDLAALGLRRLDAHRQATREVRWYYLNAGVSGSFDDWEAFKGKVVRAWRNDPADTRDELDAVIGEERRWLSLDDLRSRFMASIVIRPQRPRERRTRVVRRGGRSRRSSARQDDPDPETDDLARPGRVRGLSSFRGGWEESL